jgi:hypothetical protein
MPRISAGYLRGLDKVLKKAFNRKGRRGNRGGRKEDKTPWQDIIVTALPLWREQHNTNCG